MSLAFLPLTLALTLTLTLALPLAHARQPANQARYNLNCRMMTNRAKIRAQPAKVTVVVS